jgi:sulfofructose kinase
MASEFVDVVGVGLNATDTVIHLPRFPSPNSKVEFASSQLLLGGQVGSAMMACQAWGLRARYVGSVGDDAAADLQRSAFSEAGVEAHLNCVPGCTSQVAYILVDGPSGERTILWRRDPRLTLRPQHLRREWVTGARALLVDGHDVEAAACAARWAREAGIPVTADVDNLYPGVESLLQNVDYLISSQEFPTRLTGEPDLLRALPHIARRFKCRVVGATLGRGGVLAWDGARFHYAPAFHMDAIDTTGAGDIFHGAFVFGVVKGWPLERILDFSCAAAGLNCTALGARGGIRPLAQIERLRENGLRQDSLYDEKELSKFRKDASA